MSRALGQHYEARAMSEIKAARYQLIAQNFQIRQGEIDIIALSPGQDLCFIEVKYRKDKAFGGAISAVSKTKQAKIIKTAYAFLHQHPQWRAHVVRFDVLAFDGDHVQWIKHAFMA